MCFSHSLSTSHILNLFASTSVLNSSQANYYLIKKSRCSCFSTGLSPGYSVAIMLVAFPLHASTSPSSLSHCLSPLSSLSQSLLSLSMFLIYLTVSPLPLTVTTATSMHGCCTCVSDSLLWLFPLCQCGLASALDTDLVNSFFYRSNLIWNISGWV